MSDINKMIGEHASDNPNVLDNLADMEGWDEARGIALAAQDGIEMTEEHWEVIHFLRDYYREHGRAHSGRKLSDVLNDQFFSRGGRKHLYQLFPNGPVVQASRIGGLPLPDQARDDSFGYSL